MGGNDNHRGILAHYDDLQMILLEFLEQNFTTTAASYYPIGTRHRFKNLLTR